MFKSILPSSKRSPSFDLVSPAPVSEKENRPQHPLANVVNANDAGSTSKNSPKPPFANHKKAESISAPLSLRKSGLGPVAGGGQLVEAGAMNRAFEKMLVSYKNFRIIPYSRSNYHSNVRMTCKSPLHYVRNSSRWILPSKPQC